MMIKNSAKKKNIIFVITNLVILAIIIGVVTTVKYKIRSKQRQIKEQKIEQIQNATNELPKDYKGEVDIVEQEIKEEVIDEKTGEKKTITKKVIKQVPKGTKVQGGKVIGTTTTTKINQTKPNTTKPKTNTTAPTQNKPNTTKPKTTVPTTKRQYTPRTWTYSATKAYIKSKGGQWDDSLTLTNSTWDTMATAFNQKEMNEIVDVTLQEGHTKIKIIVVDEKNWKQYDRDFNGYNPITPSDRESFQQGIGYWLHINLYE